MYFSDYFFIGDFSSYILLLVGCSLANNSSSCAYSCPVCVNVVVTPRTCYILYRVNLSEVTVSPRTRVNPRPSTTDFLPSLFSRRSRSRRHRLLLMTPLFSIRFVVSSLELKISLFPPWVSRSRLVGGT